MALMVDIIGINGNLCRRESITHRFIHVGRLLTSSDLQQYYNKPLFFSKTEQTLSVECILFIRTENIFE